MDKIEHYLDIISYIGIFFDGQSRTFSWHNQLHRDLVMMDKIEHFLDTNQLWCKCMLTCNTSSCFQFLVKLGYTWWIYHGLIHFSQCISQVTYVTRSKQMSCMLGIFILSAWLWEVTNFYVLHWFWTLKNCAYLCNQMSNCDGAWIKP